MLDTGTCIYLINRHPKMQRALYLVRNIGCRPWRTATYHTQILATGTDYGGSRQTICAIERSKYSPSLEVAFRIANILCTSIEDLFFYEPDIEGEHEFADGIIVEVS